MKILEIPEGQKLLQCNWCDTYFFTEEHGGKFIGDCVTFHDNEKILEYEYSCPKCHNIINARWRKHTEE